MKRIAFIWFALVTIVIAACANAGQVSARLGSIQPYAGDYYDPNQSGSGLTVDIGPSNAMFLIFETYDNAGNQVNLIMQANYVPSSESDLQSSGNIGTASGTFYQVSNGQCPGCPYHEPTTTATNLTATFVWSAPRQVTMTFGTSVYHFGADNLEGRSDSEFVAGTWALAFVNDDAVYPGAPAQATLPTELAVVTIAPASFQFSQLVLDSGSSPDVKLPPSTANLYTLSCAGNQNGADDAACNATLLIFTNVVPGSQRQPIPRGTAKALVWYDDASATAGFEIYRVDSDGSIRIGPANFHGKLFVSPNLMQTHLQAQGPAGVSAAIDGTVGNSLTFTRLPSAAVRDCFDYPSSNGCQ